MHNLVNYHLFRTIHDKGLKIVFGIVALMAAVPSIMALLMTNIFGDVGLFSSKPALNVALGQYGTLLLMLTIVTTGLVYADEQHGYVKNIIGQCRHRRDNFFAKTIALTVVNIVFFVAYIMIATVCEMIFGKNPVFVEGALGVYVIRIITLFLLICAFTVFVAMLTTVLRKKTWAMLIGIALNMGAVTACLSLVDLYAKTNLCAYAPTTLMGTVVETTKTGDFLRAFVVAMVLMAVSLVIGGAVTEKRDAV